LVQTGDEGTVEGAAVFSGLVLFLLLYRVKMNKRDKYGRTVAHIAAYQGTESYDFTLFPFSFRLTFPFLCRFFRMLVMRGAQPNLIDGYGRNILHYAVYNKIETMKACLEKYANSSANTSAGAYVSP